MIIRGVAGFALCAAALVGCGSQSGPQPSADIGKIVDLKSSFSPQFSVREVAPTGIDPKLLEGQQLPDGLRFDPPSCATFATGSLVPAGTEGNMAAVAAEGQGNRFIVIAVETNEAVPVVEPGEDCRKVSFAGGSVRGSVEVVEVPDIGGAKTIGVRRTVGTVANGKLVSGEVYNYSAHFGDYQVIVSANPLVLPDKPVAPVDTQRARDLLIAGVNAIRR